MKRLKVLFFIPSLSGGGAERVFQTLISNVDREKFQPSLALGASLGRHLPALPGDVAVFDAKSPNMRSAMPKLVGHIRREEPDIVFSTLGYVNMLVMLAKPFLPRGTALIAREASIPSRALAQSPYPRLLHFMYKALYRRFDAVVCQSGEMLREMLEFYNVSRDKAVLIKNPVDTATVRQFAESAPPDFPQGALRIVTAGRLAKVKGFNLLLQALARLDKGSFHATILGEGPERENLIAQTHALGLSDSVHWHGYTENPYAFMARADVYVLSSLFEGFPNAVLEAGAVGTPTVAFHCLEDLRDIIVEGVTGFLVTPKDPEALAEGIRRAAAHTWNRADIMQSIESRYGVEKIKAAYEQLFIDVAGRKG